MNLQHILTEIEKTDPEIYERLDTRRSAMQRFAFAGKALAAAALPFALGSMFNKAYGRNTATIVEVLQYALLLEYLEAKFYDNGVKAIGLVPAGAAAGAITTIRDHEVAHVAFLKATLTSLGQTPRTEPAFDFTAKGAFPNPFLPTNYAVFLAIAQTFEDTGVRAYKGAAGDLISNNDVLTAALQIHSVEARHASHIRQMRKANGTLLAGTIKPWITNKDSNIDAGSAGANGAIQLSYNGEELTTQATVNIVNINGKTISAAAASEAFDEPLTMAQVTTIVTPFLA